MRTPHWILAIVAALLVGSLAGYLVTPAASESVSDTTKDACGPDGDSPSEDGELLRALHNISPIPRQEGEGTIEGVITDSEGNPIAGVKVTAAPKLETNDFFNLTPYELDVSDDEFWPTIRDNVSEFVRKTRYRSDPPFRASTDVEGHYVISGLPKKSVTVRAAHPDYVFESANGRNEAVPDAEQDFVGMRTFSVHVSLKDPYGAAARPANLSVDEIIEQRIMLSGLSSPQTEWSLHLPAGCYSMYAWTSARRRSYRQTVVVQPIDETQEVEIEFDAGRGLCVDVDQGALAPAAAQLTCVPDVPDLDPIEVLEANLKKPVRQSRDWRSTMSGLTVCFDYLQEGDYIVGAYGFGQLVGWKRAHYDGKSGQIFLKLEPPPEIECITCTISTPVHRPMYPRFSIEQEGAVESGLVPWRMGTLTYRLQLPKDLDRSLPGVLRLRDDRAGNVEVKLANCENQNVAVEFQPEAYLLVEWDETQFAESDAVKLKLFDADGTEPRDVRTSFLKEGAHGRVLSMLRPGHYQLRVYAPDASFPMYCAELDLKHDFNHVEIARVKLGSEDVVFGEGSLMSFELIGTVNGIKVVQRLFIGGKSDTLTGLPEGDYVIRYRKAFEDTDGEVSFSVPGWGKVTIG